MKTIPNSPDLIPEAAQVDNGDRSWRSCVEAPHECDLDWEQENPDAPERLVCTVHGEYC